MNESNSARSRDQKARCFESRAKPTLEFTGFKLARFRLKSETEHSLGPLGFECSQHRQTLRPSVDGIRSKALRLFGVQ